MLKCFSLDYPSAINPLDQVLLGCVPDPKKRTDVSQTLHAPEPTNSSLQQTLSHNDKNFAQLQQKPSNYSPSLPLSHKDTNFAQLQQKPNNRSPSLPLSHGDRNFAQLQQKHRKPPSQHQSTHDCNKAYATSSQRLKSSPQFPDRKPRNPRTSCRYQRRSATTNRQPSQSPSSPTVTSTSAPLRRSSRLQQKRDAAAKTASFFTK